MRTPPLRSGGYIKRRAEMKRTPLKQRNAERLKKRREKEFGRQGEYCRTLRCCVCEAPPPSDAAHVRGRGARGKGRGNIVPFCREHHDEQGVMGTETFEEFYGISLKQTALKIARVLFRKGEGLCPPGVFTLRASCPTWVDRCLCDKQRAELEGLDA